MEAARSKRDVPLWLRIAVSVIAALLLGPIVIGFLVVFALVAGPFFLAVLLEGAVEVHGDREGRPHHSHPGTPRGRARPVGRFAHPAEA